MSSLNRYFLFADDFMVLFLSVKHLRTVQLESQLVKENKVFAGGSNSPLPDSVSTDENPTRNFYQNMHSSLDIIKSYLFGTSFWVTLTFVFAIYNRQPYIFSLGFIISVFLLLWWVPLLFCWGNLRIHESTFDKVGQSVSNFFSQLW